MSARHRRGNHGPAFPPPTGPGRPYTEPSAVERLIERHTPATTGSDLPPRGAGMPERYFGPGPGPDHVTTLPEFAINHRAPAGIVARTGRVVGVILLALLVMAPLAILFVAASNA